VAVALAILAKAPIPGFAKTRLIPILGAERAALLQRALIARAAETASRAAVGPVTLWADPDEHNCHFQSISVQLGITLVRQRRGDLGARMLAATTAAQGPALMIGTDCPALTPEHLQRAAAILGGGTDVVMFPAEDGGYVLIGMRAPQPGILTAMCWGTPRVLGETRRRLCRLGLSWKEPAMLWDLDRPLDLERLRELGVEALMPS
jgi:rSAM/selenodomain-associated transferase 1